MLLGRLTHLDGKPEGENSMSGKPGCTESVKVQARRGPDDKVKPGLVEPQCPNCNLDQAGNDGARLTPSAMHAAEV